MTRLVRSFHAVAAVALWSLAACDSVTPVIDEGGPPFLATVSAGTILTCGVGNPGPAYCWGAGGSIGDGTTTDRLRPTPVTMAITMSFAAVSAGGAHACAIDLGIAYCWGDNTAGQLGDGTSTARLTPVAVTSPSSYGSVAAGSQYSCAVTAAGAAHCWGDNSFGQLGEGTLTNRSTPTAVTMPSGVSFLSLDAGLLHTCARTLTGATYCWGNNADGQLGDGTTSDRLVPTAVALPAGVGFSVIAVGEIHTCALSLQGAAYCWGAGHRGRLGDGASTARSTPGPVTMPSGVVFSTLGAGYAHSCGLASTGVVFCWGRNVFGEIGDGTTTDRPTPTPIAAPAGVTFTRLAVGRTHTCAVTSAGEVYCWGVNLDGQIGDGTTENRPTPVRVVPR